MVDEPLKLWEAPQSALPLWEGGAPDFQPEFGQPQPTLTPYLAASKGPTPAVVVFPGGGYELKADHEAGPIAQWLNRLGISAFVLDYRVSPYRHPIPLQDARRAVQVVRSRAAEWSIDPQRVGVIGFSAGGHLASSVGTILDPFPQTQDAVSSFSFIPNALILLYPVITSGEYAHRGSFEKLLGVDAPAEALAAMSTETRVTPQTPPTFLAHTANDELVPVENSLMFARALAACKVPFELHVFADGNHGLGLAECHASFEPWTELCARWLKNLGW